MYGAMNSFHGTRAFKDLLTHNKGIETWFLSVRDAVDTHKGAGELTKCLEQRKKMHKK